MGLAESLVEWEKVRMTIYQELDRVSPSGDTVLTIGTFDGVHLGHRKLLQRLKATAASQGLLSVVLTFRDHPRLVLNPGTKLQYITTLEERLALLEGQGIDLVIPVDFTPEVALLKASDFVALLSGPLRMRGMVVGPDFALGHRREGDISALRRLGTDANFWLETVEPASMGGGVINSSAIRDMITQGNVVNTSQMLGRWYSLSGLVVEGDRRGQLLGFPTANLSLDPLVVFPADGIYATWAIVEGQRHQAATSIGVRPTFGAGHRTVETFILDYQGDLYGKRLTLEFASRLREECAFATVDALIEQMRLDVEQSRAILSSSTAGPQPP